MAFSIVYAGCQNQVHYAEYYYAKCWGTAYEAPLWWIRAH
jgi:hypothetical protein